ncbi:hypothetical protein Leryth_005968 [Lithospermum erythrorhizon]|nr:hypothetical protein Leryth_005968 [Lithospermum erythrorhizon]
MFYIIFGWRKASKCKKLIRKVQSRLKLIKNKRSCIVRYLRDDIATLLKHGHQLTAFDRAEQLFKDECELAVYDILDNFCEFIIINFSYICKFKHCPDDINEAVSTLIFSSARFGDLPELKKIRELFQNRYGKFFATIALDLLPGNLVNQQIIDLRRKCIQSVPVDVKLKLVSEIARYRLESGQLLIDYPAQPPYRLKAEECSEDVTRSGDIIITDAGAKIVHMASSYESKNFIKDYSAPSCSLSIIGNGTESTICKKMIRNDHWDHNFPSFEPRDISEPARKEGNFVTYNGVAKILESSSESSNASPDEILYLDEIDEFVSSVRIEGNIQDQRVFMFSPSSYNTRHANIESRGILRKRSISLEKRSMMDSGSAIYYGNSYETSNRRKHLKKGSSSNCKKIEKCSVEHQCYLCKSDGLDFLIHQSVESLTAEEREEFVEDGFCCRRALSSRPPPKKDDNPIDIISRSMSSSVQQHELLTCDQHVHPNLPDYDDLAAKFISLKKAYLECSQ